MIHSTQIFYYVFGLLTALGGLMGFLKAGSRASLIAGVASGALLGLAGVLLRLSPANHLPGLILGGLVSLALLGRFAPAFLRTRKMMPAGMVSLLGLVSIILSVLAWVRP